MKTAFEQIVNVNHIASLAHQGNIANILNLAQNEDLNAAYEDRNKILLIAIDLQNDFMEGIGSLGVTGSRTDVKNLTHWMYRNMASLTHVICSLDCHTMQQIFHPMWWTDKEGKHPDPFTIISYHDVENGIWTPVDQAVEDALEYLHHLEKGNKKQLCIWPYHCIEGTLGAQLENQFTNMLYFHAASRKTAPTLIYKGQNPNTEMYGIIKAEYDKDRYVNQTVLDAISGYDSIYIAGEAASHCVLSSLIQILEYFGDNKKVTSKIIVLEDCMSPIGGFETSTKEQFDALRKDYNIQIRKSTDPIDL